MFLIGINLLVTLSIGLSTYVNRIAPREELTPTLSAGVSINHITSVGMSLVAGTLLTIVGYQALCWGAAGDHHALGALCPVHAGVSTAGAAIVARHGGRIG